jgi:hypothetical protein
MLIRALIVLLVILNVGVAAWWIFSPEPMTPNPAAAPLASPGLQLASERVPGRRLETPPPIPVNPTSNTTPAVESAAATGDVAGARCMTVGPYADASSLAAARAALQPRVSRLLVRQATSGRKGWRVWLPPLPDHASALAMAARIDAAGFKDYYVLPSGDEANGIALGRFGSEEAARRQQSSLQAAGFPAQAEALGAGTQWLDLVATANIDIDALRKDSGAAQLRLLDCAKLGP